MKQNDADTLRKYIKESLLLEFEGGGGVDFAGSGFQYGSGVSTATGGQLGKTIGRAFGDVYKAGKVAAKKALASGRRILSTTIAGLGEVLTLGNWKANYPKIEAEYQRAVQQADAEGREAIKSSWDALSKAAPVAAAFTALPIAKGALTVKAILENPQAVGAAAALAGVGGVDAAMGKIASLLGAPAGAATAGTVAAGAAAGRAASNESRKRKFHRIILETSAPAGLAKKYEELSGSNDPKDKEKIAQIDAILGPIAKELAEKREKFEGNIAELQGNFAETVAKYAPPPQEQGGQGNEGSKEKPKPNAKPAKPKK